MKQFVHLGLHTEFSLSDSLVKVKPLIKAVKEQGMGAVAISDISNMFATIRFYSAAMAAGIKPIISAEVLVREAGEVGQLTLICQNDRGYKNLIALVSRGYDEGRVRNDDPVILERDWLEGRTDGLIALSGGRHGLVGKKLFDGKRQEASDLLARLSETFPGRTYVELQRVGHIKDELYVKEAVRMAINHHLPVVATNGVRFLSPDDNKTHIIRMAISKKININEFNDLHGGNCTREQYLKSPEEMISLFSDIPSAIENTVQIAARCSVDISMGKNYLPQFPVPEGMTEADYLSANAKKGLVERLDFLFKPNNPEIINIRKKYEDRLDFELNVINQMGFPGYFLIVSDFIQWSKDNNIPVGPGRGSGAGSLVAYALKITDLDPLEYDLLFERFLNPDRVSMPDFDIDFCMDRREEVIQYVAEKYGHKSVSQIITFGTMAAKMVVRDVARALGYPYSLGNRISQMIPNTPGIKLTEALEENLEFAHFYSTDPEVKEVIDHSLKLEGITRQTGKHAGGVLISPGYLTDHTPTCCEADGSSYVSQFDKNDVETAGLVKFDFLGLRTLTIVQHAIDSINLNRQRDGKDKINILDIDLNDRGVFKLLEEGLTTAVFQVESKGMKELLKRLKPDSFEDLIALVALYRPGPLESGMVDNFINRKHGREELAYPDPTYQHESLKPILEPTYGIILYQEQVMQIAQVLAGYTLGGADMLRRAMGKKKPEEMAKQRDIFAQGAKDNGVNPELAMKIFDLVEKFAGYGFNKSHSAAYALISYQTAWLKVNYPAEFMAAVLSSDMSNTEKVVNYLNECRQMGIEVTPPTINESERHFVPSADGKKIIYGLEAVKGIGDAILTKILAERKSGGAFTSLHNLCMRCGPNKIVLQAAIKSGALDQLGPTRASLMSIYPEAQLAGKRSRASSPNMTGSLFGDDDVDMVPAPDIPEWHSKERLAGERATLGLYLSGHPLDEYKDEVAHLVDGTLAELTDLTIDPESEGENKSFTSRPVTVVGHIMSMEVKSGKKGHSAYLVLDDGTRQIDVSVYSKAYGEHMHMLHVDSNIIIEGSLRLDRQSGRHKIIAYNVKSIDMLRENRVSHVLLNLNPENMSQDHVSRLKSIIDQHDEGGCRIKALYKSDQIEKEVVLGTRELKLNDLLLNNLREIFGREAVTIVYLKENERKQNGPGRLSEQQKAAIKEEGERSRPERHAKVARALDAARMAMA